jgi:hypothetical protein
MAAMSGSLSTRNAYNNATVLNSRTLLMLDIDYGDRRFNKWVISDAQELINSMQDVKALDRKCGTRWSEQGWRVYETAHGAPLICLTMPFMLGHWSNAQSDQPSPSPPFNLPPSTRSGLAKSGNEKWQGAKTDCLKEQDPP